MSEPTIPRDDAMPRHVVAAREPSLLGECPLWSSDEQALYWVDIRAPALKRLAWPGGAVTTIPMPEHIGCIAFADGGGFVAAFRSGIWLLDRDGRRVRELAANPEDTAQSRFNDGRVDALGRLWVGTIDESGTGGAALYVLDGIQLTRIEGGLTISNGLAFSPDGRLAYHADTPRRIVTRRPIEPVHGSIGQPEPWLDLTRRAEAFGSPDGAAIDTKGCYWVAQYGGASVERYSPEGACVGTLRLPVRCPTMVAFGGPDLRTLFVTSASYQCPSQDENERQLAGTLLAIDVDAQGIEEPRFRVPPA